MKLTLRKASALQNSIQEVVKTIDVKTAITINEFQNYQDALATANDTAVKNDARRGQLTMALYTIRGQVGTANSTSGVSDKLAEAAYIDKRVGQLQGLIIAETQTEEATIVGKLEKLRGRKEDAYSFGREDGVATGVFTVDQVEQFKTAQRELKKRKQKINDEVLELNVRTEIKLAADIVATLTAEGLL